MSALFMCHRLRWPLCLKQKHRSLTPETTWSVGQVSLPTHMNPMTSGFRASFLQVLSGQPNGHMPLNGSLTI